MDKCAADYNTSRHDSEILQRNYTYYTGLEHRRTTEQYDPSHYEKTQPHSILQVPTTQLAKISIGPKFVELTAVVLEIFF